MQSGYGSSEIQQFMVDGSVHGAFFSISSGAPQNPSAASHNGTAAGDGQEMHHSTASGSNSLKLMNPFNHHHHHHHAGKPPPPPVPVEFPHFHSAPITQQLFTSRLPHPRQHQHHQHHQFQLFHSNPANYDQHRRLQSTPPFLDHDPAPENHAAAGSAMPSFLSANMNFKLAIDDSSGSGSRDGLNNDDSSIAGGILHGDDTSESRFRLWQREEDCAIKEPFCRRPLDLDHINRNNKRFKDKEPEEHHRFGKRSREAAGSLENPHQPVSGSNYKLFSELEAIYRPGNSTSAAAGGTYKNSATTNVTNQTTGSGSALTGDEHPIIPTTGGGAPEYRIDDNISSGGEAHQNVKRTRQRSRRPRQRKKAEMESIAAFFEGLVKQLMDHQDLLHQRFIDIMERCDGERAGREEARRTQEAARAMREAAVRSQDRAIAAAREAAMVSFLEKITGETLNLPFHPHQTTPSSAAITGEKLRGNCKAAAATEMLKTSRWPKAEVQTLIAVRSGLEGRFQEPGLKGPLWEEVSASMAALGYHRSSKRCKEKWENINKYFRKAKHSGRKRSQHSKTCPYFQQLDQLYSKPLPPSEYHCPSPDGLNINSELLDSVVVSGADHRGFPDGEEVGESEGHTQEQGEEQGNQPGMLIENLQ